VISLSFANIKEKSYEMARQKICNIITDLYARYEFILKEDVLGERDRAFFEQVRYDMDDSVATYAIHELSKFLNIYYGKKSLFC
jgi:hypothetical protein